MLGSEINSCVTHVTMKVRASAREHVVADEYIAYLSVAGAICEKWICRGWVEAVDGTIPTLVFQHDHRSVVGTKQAKYASGVLFGVVQDDGWSFAFSRRIQPQHHTVSSG